MDRLKLRDRLDKALSRLPEPEREVVRLRDVEGFTGAEVVKPWISALPP